MELAAEPTLAQDALAARETHDVLHRQEIHLVLLDPDQAQLVADLLAVLFRNPPAVAPVPSPQRQPGQRAQGSLARRHRFQRVVVADLIQAETAARSHLQRICQQGRGMDAAQPQTRSQVPLRVRLQGKAAFAYPPALLHRGDHVLQQLAGPHMHVDVARCDQGHACALRQVQQSGQPEFVVQVMQQLGAQPQMRSETLPQALQQLRVIDHIHGGAADAPWQPDHLAALQEIQVALVPVDPVLPFDNPLAQASRADELAQAAPPWQIPGDGHQPALGEHELAPQQQLEGMAKQPLLRLLLFQPLQLLQVMLESHMGTHDPGHRAFIGDGKRFVAELVGPSHQFFRMGGAALETEVADAMQFRITRQQSGRPFRLGRRQLRPGRRAGLQILVGVFRHRGLAGTSAPAPAATRCQAAKPDAPDRSRPVPLSRCGQ